VNRAKIIILFYGEFPKKKKKILFNSILKQK
jgi:hypothetical protein